MRIAIIDDDADERKTLQHRSNGLRRRADPQLSSLNLPAPMIFLTATTAPSTWSAWISTCPAPTACPPHNAYVRWTPMFHWYSSPTWRRWRFMAMPYMRWISYSNPSTTTPSPSKCAVFWHWSAIVVGNRSFSRRRTVFYAFHPTISTMWKCVAPSVLPHHTRRHPAT